MTRAVLTPVTVRVLSAVLGLVAVAGGVQAWTLWSRLEETRSELASFQARSAEAGQPSVAPLPPRDFTAEWPAGRIDDQVLDNALRDAQRAGVRVVAATAAVHPDSRDLLQQSQFTIEVCGTYANLKSWLTEVTGRQSGLAIDALEIRRADPMVGSSGGPQEVLATLRLRLFMRPREGR